TRTAAPASSSHSHAGAVGTAAAGAFIMPSYAVAGFVMQARDPEHEIVPPGTRYDPVAASNVSSSLAGRKPGRLSTRSTISSITSSGLSAAMTSGAKTAWRNVDRRKWRARKGRTGRTKESWTTTALAISPLGHAKT